MKPYSIAIDADTGAVTTPLVRAILGTLLQIKVTFTSGGETIQLPEGTTGRLVVKPENALDGDPGMLDTSWTYATGTYLLTSVADGELLRAALGNCGTVNLAAQVEWQLEAETEPRKCIPFVLEMVNSVSRPGDPAPNPIQDSSWAWIQETLKEGTNITFTLDTEARTITINSSMPAHVHPISQVENLEDALAGKVEKTQTVQTTGLATGGGDLGNNLTINVPIASQEEAEAGVSNTKAMTPLNTAQAIAALAGAGVDVQEFTADGTWVNPSPNVPRPVFVRLIGGGGGGGGGAMRGLNLTTNGGGGGGGGQVSEFWSTTTALNANENVIIGSGGIGGLGATTDDSGGTQGGLGGASSFGVITAGPGGGGFPANSGGGGGSPAGAVTNGNFFGFTRINSLAGAASTATAAATYIGPTGGGGGGQVNSSNFAGSGGGGGGVNINLSNVVSGAPGGGAGQDGAAGQTPLGYGWGGGGGGSSTDSNGGVGGVGGVGGGGGGGGGGAKNGFAAGNGGQGGGGYALIITY